MASALPKLNPQEHIWDALREKYFNRRKRWSNSSSGRI